LGKEKLKTSPNFKGSELELNEKDTQSLYFYSQTGYKNKDKWGRESASLMFDTSQISQNSKISSSFLDNVKIVEKDPEKILNNFCFDFELRDKGLKNTVKKFEDKYLTNQIIRKSMRLSKLKQSLKNDKEVFNRIYQEKVEFIKSRDMEYQERVEFLRSQKGNLESFYENMIEDLMKEKRKRIK